jgi:hypothetical protein
MAECVARPRDGAAARSIFFPAVLFLAAAIGAQQPNGASGMFVQFRQGPPYPIVATAPNNGQLVVSVAGTAGSPFFIASGPLNPGVIAVAGGQTWDLGSAPGSSDVTVVFEGTLASATLVPGVSLGVLPVMVPVPQNTTLPLPPLQAVVIDPMSPVGFTVTAASVVSLMPTKSVLFIQGDYDPGFGVGPTCRLGDTSFVGFSQLGEVLQVIGFSAATEVVDATTTVDAQLLAPHGIVVLGSNRRVFTPAEESTLENFVRNGGGLVSYADSTFGPGNVQSDNQILTRFGLLSASDNFGGPVVAGTFTTHPISTGLSGGIGGEGVSLVEIVGNGIDPVVNVAPCILNGGACLPYPVPAPSGLPNPTFSACAAVSAGLGRAVATFDRNTFFNWPGYGSNLFDRSNLAYAVNLFLYAGGY